MSAGWLVPGHLAPGRLTRGAPAAELPGRECLVAGRFSGSWAAGSCMSGHGWVPDAQGRSARAASAWGRRSALAQGVVEYTPCGVVRCSPCETVRPTLPCGVVCHRLPRTVARSCRAGLPKHSSCRPFVQPCCVESFVSVVARGIPSATQGTGQHLLRGVLAVLGRQCSSGQSAQLLSCGAVCSRIAQRT